MRRFLSVLLFSAALFLTGCVSQMDTITSPSSLPADASSQLQKVDVGTSGSGVTSQTLFAGQTINAGTVTYTDIDTDGNGVKDALRITYSTSNGWELVETQFFIGTSLSQMPATRTGNPVVGQFPYKSGSITGATTYSFTIPFTVLGFSCPGGEKTYFVAAHAALRKPAGTGTYQNETGWGSGPRIVERGNWATYNTIVLSCDVIVPPPPVETKTETAFAFDGDISGCFSNYSSFIPNDNRWGWTNGPLSASANTVTMPLYAAAGLCNTAAGTVVGTISVVYSGTTATVTYNLVGKNSVTKKAYTLKSAHLYVGSTAIPYVRQGQGYVYTVAPGKYPNLAEGLDATTYTFTVNNLSGDVYVIAHADVDGFPVSSGN